MKYKFGSIVFKIEATDYVNSYFEQEFGKLSTDKKFDIELRIVESDINDKCSTDQFFIDTEFKGNVSYVRCYPYLSKRMQYGSHLPELLQKFMTNKYVTVKEKIYLSFFYQIFYSFLQIKLLENSQSLFHASSVEVEDGGAILLCGKGGVGKSSTTSYLCNNIEGARFLSDDQCMITSAGKVFGNPFTIHIYPYNIDTIKPPADVIWKSILDKIQWEYRRILYGKDKVCRRIPPNKLYKETEDYNSPKEIKAIYFLNRGEAASVFLEEMQKKDFINRMNEVMIQELPYVQSISHCAVTNYLKVKEDQQRVLGALFDNVLVKVINIPENYEGDEVYNLIISQLKE